MESILRLKFWLTTALIALVGVGLLVFSVVQAAQNSSAKAAIKDSLEKVSRNMKGPIHNNQWADQSKEHETSYGEQFKAVTADLQEQGKLLERGIADPRPGAFEFLRVYPEKIRALQERLADSVDGASPRTIRDRERELLGLPGYPTESLMRRIEREYWIQEAIVSAVERTNEGLEDKILDFRPLTLRLEGKPEHFMRAAHGTRDFKCHVFQIGVTMVYEDVPAFLKELLDASLALEITSVNMELRGAGTSRTGAREPADVSGPMSPQGPDFGGGGVGPPGGLPGGGPGPMFDGGGVMDDGFTEPMDEPLDEEVPGGGRAGRDRAKGRAKKDRREAELSDRGPLLRVTIKGYVPDYRLQEKKGTGRGTSRKKEGTRNAR